MAKSFRVSQRPFNPFTSYRGGYAYRAEDPTFTAGGPSSFTKAAGLSTLPSVYKSIKSKTPDYASLSSDFYGADADIEAAFLANAAALTGNKIKLQKLEELQSATKRNETGGFLSAGLGMLGSIAGNAIVPGIGSVIGGGIGKFAGSALGSAIG
mgnify:CR=1 FL=1